MFFIRSELRFLSAISKFCFLKGGNCELSSYQSKLTTIYGTTYANNKNKLDNNSFNKSTPLNYLKRSEHNISAMVNEKEELNTFQFTNYDCIGFDLDNTLARYKVGSMIEMEYNVMSKFLVEKKGYSSKYLYEPFDHNFILRGLIVDDENGNLLRIAPDGRILQASHGTKILTDNDLERYYPHRHWEPADKFLEDPIKTWNGPYSEKMRTLLDYFDIAASLVFARAIDTIDSEKGETQSKYYVWPDLIDALQDMFNRDHFPSGQGSYFKEMKANPEKYYYKCSVELLQWLKSLRNQGKATFLITGSHRDFASHTAINTLGENWQDLFDIVVCYAKKPGFFTMDRDFLALDNAREVGPIALDDLKRGGIYTHGNWKGLSEFLSKLTAKKQPKILYVGDNLIQDVFTPNKHSNCDTVAVCEELEAEGMHGHQQWHPDQHFLTSTIWGSYFYTKDEPTNWYHIMKTYSKICVPSLEYVAALPIDYKFECNKPE